MIAEEETNKVSFLSCFPFSFAKLARGKVSHDKLHYIKKNKKEEGTKNDKNNNSGKTGAVSTFKEKR
ncbi:hypothetical protein LW139_04525 [Proteus vulgaris]|uniref:hypothetical protein n=1 Tax=Proteus TaxID=583 RepID=UPI001411BACC|nr:MULTISPECIES: hypothetical protein [Proteus]NBM55150.1 hypothetical protein [Proteus sp. G2669]UDN36927.1 hypothetical protein LG402_04460 [Proteus sp. NMG38-2]UPK81981.1 hypothetical protein LW139_04525 [Proteus vulgaris]